MDQEKAVFVSDKGSSKLGIGRQMEQEKVYMSDRDVSKLLGIGRQTLCNWRCQQKGPRYVKSGRLVRYAVSDIMAYMEARKIGTQDQPKE